MRWNARHAFGVAASCAIFASLGIVSCSDEPSLEDVAAPFQAIVEVAGAVSPPPGVRRIEVPACARGASDCPNDYPPPFYIEDVGQSDTHLYVGFRYRGVPAPAGAMAPAAAVRASVRMDGCKRGQPTVKGAVRQFADGVSWVEIPLAELPEGEIQLTIGGRVGSATAGSSLSLRKTGSSVSFLPDEQKKGYRRWTERNPVTGEAMSFVTIDEPNVECAP